MPLLSDDARRRIALEHRSALAGSILLHLLLLAWLLTLSDRPADPRRNPALRTFDLPVLPEIVEPVTPPAIPERDEDEPAGGGGGGRPAKALIVRPEMRLAPIDVPAPAVPLMLPDPVSLAIAPVAGPALINSGGEGSVSGTGAGTGDGSGSGKGSGTGTGTGDGTGAGSGDGRGRGAGLLQPAEWIVRPSDEVMQAAFPRRAALDKISGNVRLSCLVDRKQRARACRVLQEKPANYGFANAAKQAVREGRIKAPIVKDRDPTKVRVGVAIAFDHD